jgi:hypothetical protein
MKKIVLITFAIISFWGVKAQDIIQIYKAPIAPIIDGVRDDLWDNITPVHLEKDFIGESPTVNAYWKALWDDEGIYVLISVEDNDHFPGWEAGSDYFWEYDLPQVHFDVNEILKDSRGPNDRGTGHYQSRTPFEMNKYGMQLTQVATNYYPGGKYAYQLEGEGYFIEYFFPFGDFFDIEGTTMTKELFLEREIGFDIYVTDQDQGLTTTRQRKVWMNDGVVNEVWFTMDDCGIIKLRDILIDIYIENETLADGKNICFNAQNSIIVAGDGKTVTFESGSSATLIAGQSIRFLPGFYAQPGSYMSAYITKTGSFCNTLPDQTIVYNTEPEMKSATVVLPGDKYENGIKERISLKAYPNPTNGFIHIEGFPQNEASNIEVYNMLGERLIKINITSFSAILDLSHLRNGIYYLRFGDNTENGIKIIKQ